MTVELIDQLRLLGEVLDDLRSPVQFNELAERRDADVAPSASAEPTTVHLVANRNEDTAHWSVRVMAIAAAVAVIVVIAAVLASRQTTTNEPASNPPQTTTPAVLKSSQVPAGSVWLATSPTPLGTVEVVQYPGGLEICFWLTRDTPVYTAIVNGVATPGYAESHCSDTSLVSTGQLFTFFRSTDQGPGLLVGYTSTDIGFDAQVDGATVAPDSHGLWYAPANGLGNFSIHTDTSTGTVPVDPLSGPTFVVTTTASQTIPGATNP